MDTLKILRIQFQNIPLYKDGQVEINLTATDRVSDVGQVYEIQKSLYTQKLIAFGGINASGKTTALKLLYLAFSIVLGNISLNTPGLMGVSFLGDKTTMKVDFFYKDRMYELQSDIQKDARGHLSYTEETLQWKPARSIKSKKTIFEFPKENSCIKRRSTLAPETLSVLHDDDSIAIMETRGHDTLFAQVISLTNMNFCTTLGTSPMVVLNAFDPNLETLSSENHEGEISYRVKFKNQNHSYQVHNVAILSDMISSGTIKGQNLICMIQSILQKGGYLLVDELENHMNKALVQMILDLFKDPRINPKGACLLFSTHYTEILDFIDRKDDIYITRRAKEKGNPLELINYADVVRRNDVKKSEVFISNYIGGTAPSYAYIEALKEALCQINQ